MRWQIILLILILVLVIGCGRSYDKSLTDEEVDLMDVCMDSNPEQYIEEKDSRVTMASEKDVCYDIVAEDTLNFDLCGHIRNNDLHDWCYYKFAKGMKNEELCDMIKGARKPDCLNIINLDMLSDDEYYHSDE